MYPCLTNRIVSIVKKHLRQASMYLCRMNKGKCFIVFSIALTVVMITCLRSVECQNIRKLVDLKSSREGSLDELIKKGMRRKLDHIKEIQEEHLESWTEDCDKYPESCMNVSQIITYHGYPVEEYITQTADGYLLSLQRIPHGKNLMNRTSSSTSKGVVFLQHGLLCSATDWVMNLANQSLGFILADAGYDVWLGNSRGNTYSRKHIKYKPNSEKFWAWSWDEMAKYDLPAALHFVLNTTKVEKLNYVGHSQGTLIAFAEFSRNPSLAKRIQTLFALGPVSTVAHIKGLISWLAYIEPVAADLFNWFGVHEFLPSNKLLRFLSSIFCIWETASICEDVLFLVVGFDNLELNKTRIPIYISQTPAGTSVKNIVHFAQMTKSGKFQMFDYGSASKNNMHYNQSTAPTYKLHSMNVPTVIFSGGKDWLSDPLDVEQLEMQLPNLKDSYAIPEWDHLDFLWGLDANPRVYQRIIDLIEMDKASVNGIH